MRILHIDTGEEMRGGQHQVLLLLQGLRRAGHDSVLLARPRAPLAAAARTEGFTVHAAGVAELWRRSKDSTLVHAHDARGHTLAAVASRRKFVVSRRVAFPVRRSVTSSWKYRRATRFLAVSEFVAAELHEAGIPQEKIDIVYDGVDFKPVTTAWNPGGPAVALASKDPEKGRDLVELAARLCDIPVRYSENLKEDLKSASMFVYVTRSEGLGSAVLLAMSMGVPVIASRIGGLREVFQDGISGLFVENDAENIACAMRRLQGDAALAENVRRQGTEEIRKRFTREHLVRRTESSYERALAG